MFYLISNQLTNRFN